MMIGDSEYYVEDDKGRITLVATSEGFRMKREDEEFYRVNFLKDIESGRIKGYIKYITE